MVFQKSLHIYTQKTPKRHLNYVIIIL